MTRFGNVAVMRLANAWNALRGGTSKSIGYRVSSSGVDDNACVILLLRGQRGPHVLFASPPEHAVKLARSVKLAATDRARFEASDLSSLDGPTRGRADRLRAAWSILGGACRAADTWVVHYLRLKSDTEMVLVELGLRSEPHPLAQLPLTLGDATELANELERAIRAGGRR
jgi:hypothetical protein